MSLVVAENLLTRRPLILFCNLYNLRNGCGIAAPLGTTSPDRQDQGMLFSMLRIILAGDVYGAIGSHYS